MESWLFVAELGLDGAIQGVKGIMGYALAAFAEGVKGIVVSPENLEELQELSSLQSIKQESFSVIACANLKDLLPWLQNENYKNSETLFEGRPSRCNQREHRTLNFDDMILSEELENIACVVATGHHNLFMTGSPGTGKSMFSERLSIFPLLQDQEKIDSFRIYSCFPGTVDPKILNATRPFRAPHHSASPSAVRKSEHSPGEISLAHGGLLFLDEFPEFRKDVIEALRESLETGQIRISRAKFKSSWPSKFILLVAANTCQMDGGSQEKLMYLPGTQKIMAYKRKLSGPILDHIDIHIHMDQLVVNKDKFLRNLIHLGLVKTRANHTYGKQSSKSSIVSSRAQCKMENLL